MIVGEDGNEESGAEHVHGSWSPTSRPTGMHDAVDLDDLSVDSSETATLRQTLLVGSVLLELSDAAVRLHPATLPHIKSRLMGRSPLVWVEGNIINATFSVRGQAELDAVERFAKQVARLVNGTVSRAEIRGVLAAVTEPFFLAH